MKNAMKVLLVEDTVSDAMLIEHLVKKAYPGSVMLCVEDRSSYEAAITEFGPEIILSDYSMPNFDGMTALQIALEALPDTPFIIVTGSINEETAVECMKAGAWDYVLKDHLTRLDSAISRAFEQQKVYLERRMAIKALHESEERNRNLINFAPIAIGVVSDHRVVYLNPAGQKLVGADNIYEVMGKPVSEIFSTNALPAMLDQMTQPDSTEQSIVLPREDVLRRLDGKAVNVEVIAAPLQYNNKMAVQIIMTDITERKYAEREKERLREDLYQEKEYLNSLIENANTPIIIWKPDLTIADCNRAFVQLVGIPREEIVGRHVFDAMSSGFDASSYHYIKETQKGKEWNDFEMVINCKNGEHRTVIWNSANIKDSKGNFIAIIVQGTDITERKKAEENNVYISYHDHLTQLYNRRYFEHMMKKLADPSNLPITIIMGDVNGLKLINDSFGHGAGDELLIKAAEAIRRGCRDKDIVARIGGDEFGIIMTKADETDADNVIKRIREEAMEVDLDNTLLSISFGHATTDKLSGNLGEIMLEAENSMYRRKMYESPDMRNKTIDVIMNALYEKNELEMRHSKRVSTISALIAEEMGLPSEEVDKIRMSGLVHDIGKIGISEEILTKSDKLDDDEWSKMKKHAEAGWRILSSTREFADLAKHILFHHEYWDGTGYPEGLAGDDIPMGARIIAVAEAYDTMTEDKPYGKPMMMPQVIDELERASDTQFDRNVVGVFLNKVLAETQKEVGIEAEKEYARQ